MKKENAMKKIFIKFCKDVYTRAKINLKNNPKNV